MTPQQQQYLQFQWDQLKQNDSLVALGFVMGQVVTPAEVDQRADEVEADISQGLPAGPERRDLLTLLEQRRLAAIQRLQPTPVPASGTPGGIPLHPAANPFQPPVAQGGQGVVAAVQAGIRPSPIGATAFLQAVFSTVGWSVIGAVTGFLVGWEVATWLGLGHEVFSPLMMVVGTLAVWFLAARVKARLGHSFGIGGAVQWEIGYSIWAARWWAVAGLLHATALGVFLLGSARSPILACIIGFWLVGILFHRYLLRR